MEVSIEKYNKNSDQELINLFYKSIFQNRNEYEYARKTWIERYLPYENSIIRVAKVNKKIVGSLGILPTQMQLNGKKFLAGCFVDNCVSPEFNKQKIEINNLLFKEVEHEMQQKGYSLLIGWDYEKNIKNYSEIENIKIKTGINWISGGFEYKKNCPKNWQSSKSLLSMFIFMKLYNKIKKDFSIKDNDLKIRKMKSTDLTNFNKILNDIYTNDLIVSYTKKTTNFLLNNLNLQGIVFEKKGKIIGIIPFNIGLWSGWMFGKPHITKNWEFFKTLIPEEFAFDRKYLDTPLPQQAAACLTNAFKNFDTLKDTNGFVTDVFDTSVAWKKKAYIGAGYLEPKIDLGVYVGKQLKNNIKLNLDNAWHIPARNIIAPI